MQTGKLVFLSTFWKRSVGSPELKCARTQVSRLTEVHLGPRISALGKFPLCTVLFMHLVFPTLLQLIVSHRLGDFSANIKTTSDHRTQQCFLMMQSRQSEQVNLPDSTSPRISIRYKRQGFMFMLKSAFNASHKYLRLMLYFQLLFHRLDHTFLQVRFP